MASIDYQPVNINSAEVLKGINAGNYQDCDFDITKISLSAYLETRVTPYFLQDVDTIQAPPNSSECSLYEIARWYVTFRNFLERHDLDNCLKYPFPIEKNVIQRAEQIMIDKYVLPKMFPLEFKLYFPLSQSPTITLELFTERVLPSTLFDMANTLFRDLNIDDPMFIRTQIRVIDLLVQYSKCRPLADDLKGSMIREKIIQKYQSQIGREQLDEILPKENGSGVMWKALVRINKEIRVLRQNHQRECQRRRHQNQNHMNRQYNHGARRYS